MRSSKLILAAGAAVILVSGYLLADWYSCADENISKNYIGRTSCADCHQEQCRDFADSHHDKAMDVATDQSVLGDFNDVQIEHYGITSRLFRAGSKFMIHTEGPDGTMQDFEVKYVFGVSPLQQYMVELQRPADASADEIGRVQVLRISWDTEKQKWFYLSPPDVQEKLDPDDPLHWTGITQNWNTSCAECHSTNLKKNFHVATNDYRTTFSEIDVSCEACHGPASLHVELASENSFFWDRKHGMGLAKLKTVSNIAQVESCAPCHSRRSVVQDGFKPGCNFDDYYAVQLLNVPIYHADGQIRDEDYVYGSFVQSKMFHAGIRCSDCHNPHSANLIHTGNTVCTSCHQHPAGRYDSPAHHHHATGTAGAACVNCHMPATTYMEVDSRRDHSFRVPRPDMSLIYNSPNACTGCHLQIDSGKSDVVSDLELPAGPNPYLQLITAAEAGDEAASMRLRDVDAQMVAATRKWYPAGTSPPKTAYYAELNSAQHTLLQSQGQVAAVQNAESSEESISVSQAVAIMSKLASDARNPAIYRATAFDLLTNAEEMDSPDSLDEAVKILDDGGNIKVASAAIRRVEAEFMRLLNRAQASQSSAGQDLAVLRLTPLARSLGQLLMDSDSFRLRTEAARALSTIPMQLLDQTLPPAQQTAFQKGLKEYQQSLKTNNDRAPIHMVMGSLNERLGRPNDAIADYRNAIRVEPTLMGPRSNLAALLEQKAEALRQQGQVGASQLKTLSDSVKKLRRQEHLLLKRDVERSENIARTDWLNYRFGMSSYLQGDLETAEQQLKLAVEKAPENQTYLLGLATFYVQAKKLDEARAVVDRLLQADPKNRSYQMLKRQVGGGR